MGTPELLSILIGLPVYGFFAIWFVRRFYSKNKTRVSKADRENSPYLLAITILRVFDFFYDAMLLFVALSPLILITMPFVGPNSEIYGINISPNFKLDLTLLLGVEISGLKEQIINGSITLEVIPPNNITWYLYALDFFAEILVSFFILHQLREIFALVSIGEALVYENTMRLKRIGFVILGWSICSPLLQSFLNYLVLKEISINTKAINFIPGITPDLSTVFIGLSLLVLSGVIYDAVKIRNEQRLTI